METKFLLRKDRSTHSISIISMMGVQEIHYIFFVQQVSFKTTVNNYVFVVAAKSSKGMLYNFSNVYGIYNFRIRYYI